MLHQIKSIYLSLVTWGVIAQSPEPKARVSNLWAFQIELEFRSVGFGRGENRGTRREKPLRTEERTIHKLNPHDNAESRNRTAGPLVGGECAHHYTILAPTKIQIFNGMCNQHSNKRSSEFDSTREVYNQINNLANSSQFNFTGFNKINVSTDNITFTRNVLKKNAWSDSVPSPIFWLKHFKVPPARILQSHVLVSKVGNALRALSFG